MSKIMLIDGLEVELTRKRIRRMNLRISDPDARVTLSIPYGMPESEAEAFVRAKRKWIDRNAARILARAAEHPEPADDAEKEERRADLKRRISILLPQIEEITGLSCTGWTVRDMHTRWGSCNTVTHHLNFSLMLATRSDAELAYVILHELVHTIVPGHGPDFYAEMDRFMPGWKEVRRSLKS